MKMFTTVVRNFTAVVKPLEEEVEAAEAKRDELRRQLQAREEKTDAG